MHGQFVGHRCLLVLLILAVASSGAFGQFRIKPRKDDSRPQRESETERDEASRVLAPLTGEGAAGPSDASWSIVLLAFGGPNQEALARQELSLVVSRAGLVGAQVEKRDKATVIAYGRYEGAEDPRAQEDLERVRSMRVDGSRPFAAALLSPPSPSELSGSLPQLDLRNAKEIFGKDRALYTLQVAIYGRGDRSRASPEEVAEFRAAAERAAVLLRRDGDLAFYYHAHERSMVTVGVFGQEDYDPLRRQGLESYELMQARERHPLNLLNGKGIRERIPGFQGDGPEAFRLQRSKLVAIPEN